MKLFARTVLAGTIAAALVSTVAAQENSHVPYQEGHRPEAGHARPPFHLVPSVTNATVSGKTPALIRHAYGFDLVSNQGAGQTIAIVDAYDHPAIESDLSAFSNQFGLTACTTANGCFKKIYASGKKPAVDAGWALEISLDVEWAHAIAPQANIILVEAASSSFSDLMNAVDVAVRNGATVVSMSFGGSEFSSETYFDSHFKTSGVTFVASSGDSGYGVEYPAASQYVLSVGGTTLTIDSYGNYLGETAWSGSGGGVSAYEPETTGQSTWPLPYAGKRGAPDVSYNGNPSSGFAVYDSVTYNSQSGWFQVGGTSAGAPQWAALISIANSVRRAGGKTNLSSTYNAVYTAAKSNYTTTIHDVATGSNGSCGTVCNAGSGYDYVTGLGSPRVDSLVSAFNALP
jgi:subtilase family serine protease